MLLLPAYQSQKPYYNSDVHSINYSIDSCSTHPPSVLKQPLPDSTLDALHSSSSTGSQTSNYLPQNITADRPSDQNSRWSAEGVVVDYSNFDEFQAVNNFDTSLQTIGGPQMAFINEGNAQTHSHFSLHSLHNKPSASQQHHFIILKFKKPALINSIKFGKFHKVHVCNMKEFKVYGGMNKQNMKEILHSGLRNDDQPEKFFTRYQTESGINVPCQFIKIEPISAWGTNYHPSIWYTEVFGIQEPDFVDPLVKQYKQSIENEALRTCLKFFRKKNMIDMFKTLESQVPEPLEDSICSNLHQALVFDGDFDRAEKIMRHLHEEKSVFENYASGLSYTMHWSRIYPKDNNDHPSMRGGHQMIILPSTEYSPGSIFLYGGWNGRMDLSDFWEYKLETGTWHCISKDTSVESGPSPRSCHKMCLDTRKRCLYTFGRYVDPESRQPENTKPDLYRYWIDEQQWECISTDTLSDGGPPLLYDHGMAMDSDGQDFYVLGGRSITASSTVDSSYSGLYKYNVPNNTWTLLRPPDMDSPHHLHDMNLQPRTGHGMVFDPKYRRIFILAGQRHKDYLGDFYLYSIDDDCMYEISRDTAWQGGPGPGHTVCMTLDSERQELYVLTGFMQDRLSSGTGTSRHHLWVYNIGLNSWQQALSLRSLTSIQRPTLQDVEEPSPRFAHQFCYDPLTQNNFLFGGNPGSNSPAGQRLNDFWSVSLSRPATQDIMKRTLFLIRKQRYIEMCGSSDSTTAMRYLQKEISEVVDHSNAQQSTEFRALSSILFQKSNNRIEDLFSQRTSLFEDIIHFFPKYMQQPTVNLDDLV
eukprot:gb/GECH01001117.1/.p1 GENE.gb/GECH01001117.1/~~gb/GECH01001117.1/.p1  ORF type:complete len:811 (+),score=134.38 gb/GECH01001117.1/:1-2433(+)